MQWNSKQACGCSISSVTNHKNWIFIFIIWHDHRDLMSLLLSQTGTDTQKCTWTKLDALFIEFIWSNVIQDSSHKVHYPYHICLRFVTLHCWLFRVAFVLPSHGVIASLIKLSVTLSHKNTIVTWSTYHHMA